MYCKVSYLRICKEVVKDTELMLRGEDYSQNSRQGPEVLHGDVLVGMFELQRFRLETI